MVLFIKKLIFKYPGFCHSCLVHSVVSTQTVKRFHHTIEKVNVSANIYINYNTTILIKNAFAVMHLRSQHRVRLDRGVLAQRHSHRIHCHWHFSL